MNCFCCLSKHEQRLSLTPAFSSALHPCLAHYCQRFDASPALSFVGHDGDSVSTLQSQNSAQCEGSPKFIKGIICIWVPETFGASGFYFGIWDLSLLKPGWKAEISLLRTTSWRSGARWFTAPRLGWRQAATAPCSTPLTSSLGNTTHPTSPWVRTQVSFECSSSKASEWQGCVQKHPVTLFCLKHMFCILKTWEPWSSLGRASIYCGRILLWLCGRLEISRCVFYVFLNLINCSWEGVFGCIA